MGVNGSRAVTVFGGSRVRPGSVAYQEACYLGSLLASSGFVLCNGGYCGTMEAAARGAKEAGGRTVGCTVDLLVGRRPNEWVDEEQRSESLFLRLERLTERADAFVALRGGVGTLLEVALVWNLAQLDGRARKPIILVGTAWQQVLSALSRELYVRPEDLAHMETVDSVDAAVRRLRELLG